jgi:hypothetical protein
MKLSLQVLHPMRNKRSLLIIIGIICFWGCTPNKQKLGNELIKKVEAYQNTHHQLPQNISELGMQEKEEGPVYYLKQTDTSYIVWYGLELGESKTYSSVTKQWK